MKRLKAIWRVIKSRHYAVLVGDNAEEIVWAMETLIKAQKKAKKKVEEL
jgi:hypothetical protein